MESGFRVVGWEQYQHYKKRNPPWIKLHFALLSSQTWVMLDDASRVLAVASMLIASKHDGRVPANANYIRRVAYLSKDPDFKPLVDAGFLEPFGDASTMLAHASTMQADARPEQSRGETEERRAERKRGQQTTPEINDDAPLTASQIEVVLAGQCSGHLRNDARRQLARLSVALGQKFDPAIVRTALDDAKEQARSQGLEKPNPNFVVSLIGQGVAKANKPTGQAAALAAMEQRPVEEQTLEEAIAEYESRSN